MPKTDDYWSEAELLELIEDFIENGGRDWPPPSGRRFFCRRITWSGDVKPNRAYRAKWDAIAERIVEVGEADIGTDPTAHDNRQRRRGAGWLLALIYVEFLSDLEIADMAFEMIIAAGPE